jgi:predicted dehydrogenase
MSRSSVNWGVLGASNFARKTMAPAINEARRSRLCAVATRDPAKAAPFAERAPGLRVHDSYEAMLTDPEIDAVYIPLPNGLHVEWTERAARAGKSVLCEKPIGLGAHDVERLIALRNDLGVFIAEAWMPAHHPQWTTAREIVQGGGIGRLHTVTGVFTYGLSDPANVRNSADLGGGALRDVGVYPIGAFRFATGLEPQVMSAEAEWEDGIDASTWVQARAGDTRFRFHVSMRTTKRQEMVFEGDGGWLVAFMRRSMQGSMVRRTSSCAAPTARRRSSASPPTGNMSARWRRLAPPCWTGRTTRCRWKCRSGRSRWSTRYSTPCTAQGRLWRTNGGRFDRAPER